MRCLACPDGHALEKGRGDPGNFGGGQRVVFFLADQAFPPSLGTLRGNCCTFIVRIEFGFIPELMQLFFKSTRDFILPPGSLVVISSASQLMVGGLSDYTRDLLVATEQVGTAFAGEVDLVPGPPILLGGTVRMRMNNRNV